MFARIDGLIACEVNQAIIFRRGPSKRTQQLLWDLNTDAVIPGQWIQGNVHLDDSDVSPNGRYLIAELSNYRWPQPRGESNKVLRDVYSWTAVSRPPYFTALALWASNRSGSGGGFWEGNRKLLL